MLLGNYMLMALSLEHKCMKSLYHLLQTLLVAYPYLLNNNNSMHKVLLNIIVVLQLLMIMSLLHPVSTILLPLLLLLLPILLNLLLLSPNHLEFFHHKPNHENIDLRKSSIALIMFVNKSSPGIGGVGASWPTVNSVASFEAMYSDSIIHESE